MSNLIYGIFYADGYVDGGRDTIYHWKCVGKVLGGKRNEWSLWNGNEYFPEAVRR